MPLPKPPPAFLKKDSPLRKEFARRLARLRAHDAAGEHPHYRQHRALAELPFHHALVDAVRKRLARPRVVRVLEKGAGSGRALAELKALAPEKIHATAISLRRIPARRYAGFLDQTLRGIGLRALHAKKFDIIYDAYGEDYYLPKPLIPYSIEKTLHHLVPDGEAFVLLSLRARPGPYDLSIEEGRALAARLQRRAGLSVTVHEIERHIKGFDPFVDLVLHIRKRSTRQPR